MRETIFRNNHWYGFKVVALALLLLFDAPIVYVFFGAAGMWEVRTPSGVDETAQQSVIIDIAIVPQKMREIRELYKEQGCSVRFTASPPGPNWEKVTKLSYVYSCGSKSEDGKVGEK